jgi:hypothetical protein
MLRTEVEKRIEKIRRDADDPESAHILEKQLWRDILKEVAECHCCTKCKKMARLALTTEDISFPRWYA